MASDVAPPDRLVGEVIDGRWKLVDRLGAGGMGVVYRAERVKLGKAVAVKLLDERSVQSDEAVARFEREARAISRLQHRHCVSIFDFGVWRRRPYIVMELVSGRPLNQEMGKPTMTPARGVAIMRQMLEALRHAHGSGVVHRDLKPENVMLTESTMTSDFVKLLDFGLARIISVDEPSISVPNTVAGTPSYMSPEQARGEKVDHRTDIYSAGVMLYGMCTGKKPFTSADSLEVLRMHIHAAPVPPRKVAPGRGISPSLEKVILRAMEKERDARFYHADEFLAALEAVPEARRAARAPGRRKLVLAAATLVVAGAGAVVWQARARIARPWLMTWAPSTTPAAAPPVVAAPATAPPIAPPIAAPTVAAAPVAAASPAAAPLAAAAPMVAAAPGAATASGEAVAPASGETVAPASGEAAKPATASGETVAPAPGEAATAAASGEAAKAAPSGESAPPTAEAAAVDDTPPLRRQIAALVDAGKLADAERMLLAEEVLEPRAGWVHLDLADLYFRRIWRKDAEREWERALALDASLARDPRLGEHLCTALGPAWNGAGQRLVVRHLGADAVAPLTACIRDTDDLARVKTAAALIERVAGRERLDTALVESRTAELSHKGK